MYLQAVLSTSAGSTGSISRQTTHAKNRRRTKRRSLTLSAFASSSNESGIPVLIRDISPGGLLIQAEPGTVKIDDEVTFELAGDTLVRARVAWMSERLIGCEFETPVSVATVSAALLKAEPQFNRPDDRSGRAPRSRDVNQELAPEANFSFALILAVLLWVAGGSALALAF
jgi:hypothetical protein